MKQLTFASLTALLLLPINVFAYHVDINNMEEFSHWQTTQIERANYTGSYDYYTVESSNAGGDIYGSFTILPEAGESSDLMASVAITHTFIDEGARIIDSGNFTDINFTYTPPALPEPITEVVSVRLNDPIDYIWNYTAWGDFFMSFDAAFDNNPTAIDPNAYSWATLYASYRVQTSITFLGVTSTENPVPNPEPATLLLFGLGAAGLIGKKKFQENK